MEGSQSQSLFSLAIDPITKSHLSETARWARFLAILGMVSLGLMIIAGAVYSIWISTIMDSVQNESGFQAPPGYGTGYAVGAAFMFIIFAAIYFFPLLYMLRFANQMKAALYGNDQENLNSSFQNLKRCFRYVGIMAIIGIAIWIIWFLVIGVAVLTIR